MTTPPMRQTLPTDSFVKLSRSVLSPNVYSYAYTLFPLSTYSSGVIVQLRVVLSTELKI